LSFIIEWLFLYQNIASSKFRAILFDLLLLRKNLEQYYFF